MVSDEEQKQYDYYQGELDKLSSNIDSQSFKSNMEYMKYTFEEYLRLSKLQNEIIKHGRKRQIKDKGIKVLYDYACTVMEMKQKSSLKYIRMKDNFMRLLNTRLNKIKGIKKRG